MIGWFIVACEISFWIFVFAGLLARYGFDKKGLGTAFFICTPLIDVALLVATVIDLKKGAVAETIHGLAAVYIGVSIAFGHRMIQWADAQFAYRFKKGKRLVKRKKFGREKAKEERAGWYRHLLAWLIGGCLLIAMILYIHDPLRTQALTYTLLLWTWILLIDFIISFSYTLFPKKN